MLLVIRLPDFLISRFHCTFTSASFFSFLLPFLSLRLKSAAAWYVCKSVRVCVCVGGGADKCTFYMSIFTIILLTCIYCYVLLCKYGPYLQAFMLLRCPKPFIVFYLYTRIHAFIYVFLMIWLNKIELN